VARDVGGLVLPRRDVRRTTAGLGRRIGVVVVEHELAVLLEGGVLAERRTGITPRTTTTTTTTTRIPPLLPARRRRRRRLRRRRRARRFRGHEAVVEYDQPLEEGGGVMIPRRRDPPGAIMVAAPQWRVVP
jgi:hypothetical protein